MPTTTDMIDATAQFLQLIPTIVATANTRVPIVADHTSQLESKQLGVPLIVPPLGLQTRQQKASCSCRRMEAETRREIAASKPAAISHIGLHEIKNALNKVANKDCYNADGNKKNTAQAYHAVYKAYDVYCNHQYLDIPVLTRYDVNPVRVHGFMTNTAFRRQKEPVQMPFSNSE